MPLFPRLDDGPAVQTLLELEGGSPSAVAEHAAVDHPRKYFFTPGPVADDQQLRALQERIRSTAASTGYPQGGSQRTRTDFDIALGRLLAEEAIDDAGARAVWTFVGCVLVPDVVTWRWGWRQKRHGPPLRGFERYLGGHRNALRRCWYRRWRYGWGDGSAIDKVWEDAIVGVEERPSLGADNRVAEMVFTVAPECFPESMPYELREDAFRDGVKRLRQRAAVVELSLLPDEQLRDVVRTELSG